MYRKYKNAKQKNKKIKAKGQYQFLRSTELRICGLYSLLMIIFRSELPTRYLKLLINESTIVKLLKIAIYGVNSASASLPSRGFGSM